MLRRVVHRLLVDAKGLVMRETAVYQRSSAMFWVVNKFNVLRLLAGRQRTTKRLSLCSFWI
jgi:hypothetical protein